MLPPNKIAPCFVIPMLSIMQNSKKTFSHNEKIIEPKLNNYFQEVCSSKYSLYNFKAIKTTARLSCLMLVIFFSSCGTTRQQVYFQNLQKDTTLRNIVTPDYDLKIQKNDMLGITVASLSPDIALYNAPQNTMGTFSGYKVDQNGNIAFIKLGCLHVEGMTRKQLKDSLQSALVPYLKEAVVSVAFLNRHVTILGAVGSKVLPIPEDNLTLLDALASSGDIGEKGRIDNILLIRDTGSAKVFKRLSLKDNSVFYSPYYYLQPNDIVYVEPSKIKTPLTAPQIITYITTGISLIFLVLNTFKL